MSEKFEITLNLITDFIDSYLSGEASVILKSQTLKEYISSEWDQTELLTYIQETLEEDTQLYILSLSAIYSTIQNPLILNMIEDTIIQKKLPEKAASQIAYQLRTQRFVNGFPQDYEKCYALNTGISEHYFDELNIEIPMLNYENRNHNSVLLTVHTLLSISHAPTKWAFTVARHLQELGYEVMIIIEGEPIDESLLSTYWIGNSYSTNYGYDFGPFRIFVDGHPIQCYQININNSSHEEMLQFIQNIYNAYRPEFIWKIGGLSRLDKIWSSMSTFVVLPCHSGYDACMGNLMLKCLPSNSDEADERFLHSHGQQTMAIQFKEYNFSDPEADMPEHRREMHNISDSAFVISIVGNRLNVELTPDFFDMLEYVISKNPSIQIVLIGNYDYDIRPALSGKIKKLGYCDNLESAIAMTDLFVNPKRGGGGTSAKLSLKSGVPIVTLPNGDIADIAGDHFICDDYNKMADLIIRYAEDHEFYYKQSVLAKQEYQTRFDIDMESEVRRVIDKALEIGKSQSLAN